MIHRDLKPENLFLTKAGLRILDFGLAKLAEPSAIDVTEPGTLLGTAGYMAPEQARGEPADARSDLFSVGAIAYELATGQRAFPGATQVDRLTATLRDTPVVTGELAPILERCLAKQPADRFQSALDLAWALQQTLPSVSVPSRRGFLVGGIAAAAFGVAGYLFGRRERGTAAELAFRPISHRVGRVYTARFAPDGNHVFFGAAWASDPVHVHELDLASGQSTILDLPSADLLAVSQHDELAANLGLRFVDHQSARGELARFTLGGGSPRPVAADVQDADFSGEALAIVRALDHGFRIELPAGTKFVDEPGWVTHLRVSPDGKQLAYLRHPHTNDDGGELVHGDIATRTVRVLGPRWTSLAGLAWDPAGKVLWFTASAQDLNNTLHRVELDGTVRSLAGPSASRLRDP